ncbi:hypothetical protein FGO68_gene9351 [Halteria grandinella]|uniref:Non-homologous end-joining factor 1 n=1 Tax=Halteria grandinella TaxID=5974 RepID=A0A8J8NYY7_HALGN|nr:hypothetical protein FGO68_gene9351 [Halteria grandinella]
MKAIDRHRVSLSPPHKDADTIPHYLEHIVNQPWYTACPNTPYLIKAGANSESGYQILVTDLESTWYCSGDLEIIRNEKKMYNPTIKTDEFDHFVSLLHAQIATYDPNTVYTIKEGKNETVSFSLKKNLEIYPFEWHFTLSKLPHEDHLQLLRHFLVSPLISTINSLQNKYSVLLKRHQQLESLYKERAPHSDLLKFTPFLDDPPLWTKSISIDELKLDLFPQLKVEPSMQHIYGMVSQAKFELKYEEYVREQRRVRAKRQAREVEREIGRESKKMNKLKLDESPAVKKGAAEKKRLLEDEDELPTQEQAKVQKQGGGVKKKPIKFL